MQLHRRYGDFVAVHPLSLSVAPGEILAFLGSNGAGKTTTVKMIMGLLRPTGGRVEVSGRDLWAEGAPVRRLIGYVPDLPLLYEGLTAREYLWLVAGLYGLDEAAARPRAAELLYQLKLERWQDHLIKTFSLGMKRKMAIAAALMHRPQVLLLDEATNGLDPRAAREVKDMIALAARGGAAVFLTTHLHLLSGAATALVAACGGLEPGAVLELGLLGCLAGMGMVVIMVGGAALDAGPPRQAEQLDEGPAAVLLEQAPRGPGGIGGLLAAGGYGALVAWAAGSAPWWAMLGLVVSVPALALIPGYLLLRRLLVWGGYGAFSRPY